MLTHRFISRIAIIGIFILLIFHFTADLSLWYLAIWSVLWLALTIIGSFYIQWNYHVKAINHNKSISEKKVAITFDDGPNQLYTPKVLELLEKYNTVATFFCIGKYIEKHPDLIKTIVNKGHSVGNHSYSHSSFFDFYGTQRVVSEIEKTNQLIKRITGEEAIIFRPPYGVTNPSIRKAISLTKHHVIGWNVRSLDTVIKNEAQLVNRIVKKVTPGSIILLHDTHEGIVVVLEQLLIFLQQNNYQTVSIKELCNVEEYA